MITSSAASGSASIQRTERARVREMLPGLRHFWDFDGAVSRLYGAMARDAKPSSNMPLRRFWMVLDPALRVRAVFPFAPDGAEQDKVIAYLRALPPLVLFAGIEVPPPVIVIPNVFEPELCRRLIGLYEEHGGEESGFMREVAGRTVEVSDPRHKRRRDYTITDEALIQHIQGRIVRRVNPEVEKVHFFKPTRMERDIVSCYAAEDGGHLRAHRDNTTRGTAHAFDDVLAQLLGLRRYACSLTRDEGAAEDLVHDALVRADERRSTFRLGGDLRTWLLSILHNAFIDGQRRRVAELRREAETARLSEVALPPDQEAL